MYFAPHKIAGRDLRFTSPPNYLYGAPHATPDSLIRAPRYGVCPKRGRAAAKPGSPGPTAVRRGRAEDKLSCKFKLLESGPQAGTGVDMRLPVGARALRRDHALRIVAADSGRRVMR